MALQLPGPINYGIDVPDPSQAFLSAFKTGTAITETRMAQEQAQRQAEQQQLISQAFQRLRQPGATAKDYADLAMMLPETQAKAVRESFSMITADQQQNALNQAGQVFSAFKSGKPDIAVGLIERQIEAKRNSGDEQGARFLETWRDVAKENPKAAEDYFGFTISQIPGGDKVIDAVSKLQASPSDTELRAAMEGVETVDDVFARIPQLAQLGDKGMEYAKAFLTQQRLIEKQRAEGIGEEEQRLEKDAEVTKAYGMLKVAFPEGSFELIKTRGGRFDIEPTATWSDMVKTGGGIQIDERKAGMLGLDPETTLAIKSLATTDPKTAAKLMTDVIRARIKTQLSPARAQKMSPAALKLVEAGYEYGSPEFVKQMQMEIDAERTGRAKGSGVQITNIMDKKAGEDAGKLFDVWFESAASGNQQLRDIDGYEAALRKAITGPLAGTRLKMAQVANILGLGGEESVGSTRALLQGLSEMTLQARGMLKGQGAITDNEQVILQQARAGDISMTPAELKVLFGAVRRAVSAKTQRDTNMLKRSADKGSEVARMYLDEVESGAYKTPQRPGPGAPVSVTAPNGQVLTFPSQQAADAFQKAAGIR